MKETECKEGVQQELEAHYKAILRLLGEDTDREGFLHDYNIPQYIATLSIKP